MTKTLLPEWDYLIVTASNEPQAAAYRRLVGERAALGLLGGIGRVLVVADPGGRRVGSGGSTIHCLLRVLERELGARAASAAGPDGWRKVFERLRTLIVHAGGDSKRLPPYGPCGKLFIPVPGATDTALGTTIFDRLIPAYLALPVPEAGPETGRERERGQVVVASGDVLLTFDAAEVRFAAEGMTGVGSPADPVVAARHGVYCADEDGRVRLFLQKPSVAEMRAKGAVDAHGRAVLDIGILNLDPESAVRLIGLCGVRAAGSGRRGLAWSGRVGRAIETAGLDLYREVCCALGRETRFADYAAEVRAAGSRLGADVLKAIFDGLRGMPFHVAVVPRVRFLHFGTLRELVASSKAVLTADMGLPDHGANVVIDTAAREPWLIQGKGAWVEGCRVEAPLVVPGENVVVGVDVEDKIALPPGACLECLPGRDRRGRRGRFVRVYGIDDTFHVPAGQGARFGGRPVDEWLEAMGAETGEVWAARVRPADRSVWNGRFFPFVGEPGECRRWLWLSEPGRATAEQKKEWRVADRYSFEDMARLSDLEEFHSRRRRIRARTVSASGLRAFNPESELSAADMALLVRSVGKEDGARWLADIIREAGRRFGQAGGEGASGSARGSAGAGANGGGAGRGSVGEGANGGGVEALELARILHSLGSCLLATAAEDRGGARDVARRLGGELGAPEKAWLEGLGAAAEGGAGRLERWAGRMKQAAFAHVGRTIVRRDRGMGETAAAPRNCLRGDEIVWGRAPARLDLGGGWTDTPPYSLERGGCVINAAVDLNGQAPIQAYARVIDRPEVRINSIDASSRVVVRGLGELLDYRRPGSQSALAKAALALAGFAPEAARWPSGAKDLAGMLRRFGGGIELTTLAAIPSGSGLGTSSIMGAVLIAVIGRVMGRTYTPRELFHAVLQLEQELTTGGGWQDQVGGAVEGVKMITAEKGLVPNPRIHFVPGDLLDPEANGGRTLLYYTGLRRLAKNILHDVVGRYLDRDRGAMATLRRLHAFPQVMAQAMGERDMRRFGELIDVAWRLNVDLDPDHSTPVIEGLRRRIAPHIYGAKLLGAGGGGFLLIVCRSAQDAEKVRRMLETDPPNDKARFFAYSISREGLVVTVC